MRAIKRLSQDYPPGSSITNSHISQEDVRLFLFDVSTKKLEGTYTVKRRLTLINIFFSDPVIGTSQMMLDKVSRRYQAGLSFSLNGTKQFSDPSLSLSLFLCPVIQFL